MRAGKLAFQKIINSAPSSLGDGRQKLLAKSICRGDDKCIYKHSCTYKKEVRRQYLLVASHINKKAGGRLAEGETAELKHSTRTTANVIYQRESTKEAIVLVSWLVSWLVQQRDRESPAGMRRLLQEKIPPVSRLSGYSVMLLIRGSRAVECFVIYHADMNHHYVAGPRCTSE